MNRRERRKREALARKEHKRILAASDVSLKCSSGIQCIIAEISATGKNPTFSGIAYTGAPMTPQGFTIPVICDLDGFEYPEDNYRPALRQHEHKEVVGHTTKLGSKKDGLHVEGEFSGEDHHRNGVIVPASRGNRWQLSIGANIVPEHKEYIAEGDTATVNGREVEGPMIRSRRTKINEISFVPLGADQGTSVTVNASGERKMNEKTLLKNILAGRKALGLRMTIEGATYSDEDIDKMDKDQARAALRKCMAQEPGGDGEEQGNPEDEDEKKQRKNDPEAAGKSRLEARKADAAEYVRVSKIKAEGVKYGAVISDFEIEPDKKVNLIAHAIEQGWDVEKFHDKAELAQVRAQRPGPDVGSPHFYVTNPPELNAEVIEAACFQAARHNFKLNDDSFYIDAMPGGGIRRMPQHVEAEARGDWQDGGKYTDKVQQHAHTMFKGQITPRQIIEKCFRAHGYRERELDLKSQTGIKRMLATWSQLDAQEHNLIRAEGASSMSISNILANVLNKFALQGYLFTEQAWRDIAGIRPVNDFKPVKSINLLGDVMFKTIGIDGEITNAIIQDQAFANQAQPFARILTIPWQNQVNDDLGILTQAPMKMGQGAGLALNDWFWALWASLQSGSAVGIIKRFTGYSLNGDDGVSFWRTTSSLPSSTSGILPTSTYYNKNKLTGAGSALSSTALQTAQQAFFNQVDPNGNPLGFDGLMPILLFGPANWQVATELVSYKELIGTGQTSTSRQPNGNVWVGKMKPVMSRYIENTNYVNSTTAWWVLFDPAAVPVIEVAFLNGVDTPAILQASPDWQFDKLGISIRGTYAFGVNQQNFRGGIYNAGA